MERWTTARRCEWALGADDGSRETMSRGKGKEADPGSRAGRGFRPYPGVNVHGRLIRMLPKEGSDNCERGLCMKLNV